jgi:hypothetical protein
MLMRRALVIQRVTGLRIAPLSAISVSDAVLRRAAASGQRPAASGVANANTLIAIRPMPTSLRLKANRPRPHQGPPSFSVVLRHGAEMDMPNGRAPPGRASAAASPRPRRTILTTTFEVFSDAGRAKPPAQPCISQANESRSGFADVDVAAGYGGIPGWKARHH